MFYNFKTIDITGLDALAAQAPVRLIDVRTEAEVARGAIAGAIHIPLHLLPIQAGELDDTRPTVVYCQSGVRSAQACSFLAAKGFANLYNLQGGIKAWLNSGRALWQPAG